MTMAKSYNYYDDVKAIYDAKVGWNQSTTDADRQKYSETANAARKRLSDYGYADIANEMSASGADATAARKIMEKYAPTTTTIATKAPDSTSLTNSELITVNNNESRNTINQTKDMIVSDRNKYYTEYDKVSDYVNSDVTKTDEYKSTYDNLIKKYDMSAMQGRDNELASGSASNGGNIDSFAAANAMRQQAALTAQGQQVAHQAGLDAYNARVNNARGILSDLGVYQNNSWNAMGTLVDKQATEGQRLFENEETAKNNEAARQQVYSDISGTVGDTVTKYLNSNVWNSDGTLKNYNTDYLASMQSLEKQLETTTNANERARIIEQLRVLEAARNQKIDEQGLTYGKTYKYQASKQSEAGREFDVNADISRDTLAAEKEANEKQLQNNLDQIKLTNQGTIEQIRESAKYSGNETDDYAAYNVLLSMWTPDEQEKRAFIEGFIKPIYEGKETITPEGLKTLILANTEKYNIDVDDAQKICQAFDVSTDWLKDYRDRTNEDGEVKSYNDKTRDGIYGGMVKK